MEQCRRNEDLPGFEVVKGKKLHGALCGYMVTSDTTDVISMHTLLQGGYEGHAFSLWLEKGPLRRMRRRAMMTDHVHAL
jgi:hypothetical protein